MILWNQWPGLIGSHGVLPATRFVARIRTGFDFLELPTLFWWGASDRALQIGRGAGLVLSIAVMLGVENAVVMAALWAIYMSFCHIGQTFYGYGWEILLLETASSRSSSARCASLRRWPAASRRRRSRSCSLRWLVFRVMLGAGLIKIRGDACWRDLTCLAYHYETQPVPGPLSPLLHRAPLWFHKAGVAFNHVVELGAPWLVFGPRRLRILAGGLIVAFQAILIASGNLSFLNWLTIVIAIACFDDGVIARILPRRLVVRAQQLEQERRESRARPSRSRLLAVLVAVLSLGPISNMLSRAKR